MAEYTIELGRGGTRPWVHILRDGENLMEVIPAFASPFSYRCARRKAERLVRQFKKMEGG